MKFFRESFEDQSQQLRRIVSYKLRSYKTVLRDLNCQTRHITARHENNISKLSHQKNTAAATTNAAVQISWPSTTIFCVPRSDQ
jgi:hypothetical protein